MYTNLLTHYNLFIYYLFKNVCYNRMLQPSEWDKNSVLSVFFARELFVRSRTMTFAPWHTAAKQCNFTMTIDFIELREYSGYRYTMIKDYVQFYELAM